MGLYKMSAKTKQADDHQIQPQEFSADVSRLLDIVAHALYTNHDVFLRELISNAADACDRLRYDAIANPGLITDNPEFRICTFKDTTDRTMSVIDNGIGMNDKELIDNLGTIAKSGTAALMEQMKATNGDNDKLKLIGQFGVGFYAGYMVAHKIEVVSRKAGEDTTWYWESDGKSGFIVREATETEASRLDGERGTAITLQVKDEACEFLLDEKIKATVQEYSDHISVPIYLGTPSNIAKDKDVEPINSASALWMRSKNEITKPEYQSFYNHISNSFDEPVMTSHWKAEGKIEFTALLYIPTLRPWDLFDPSRRHFVKLYVRRVFITQDLDTLMYPWLRFIRGVIDSEDLPLNISRESLQYNPTIEKIRSAVARKVLGDLDKLSRDDPPAFSTFWGQFGPALKEGLYDAPEHRETLLKVCRFYSSKDNGDKFTTLEEYLSRMIEGQETIFYISGENINSVRNSPQLEGFRAKGIEVLFLTDTIDDFWLQNVLDYKGKVFKSITKGDIDLGKFDSTQKATQEQGETSKENSEELEKLISTFKDILKDQVSGIKQSQRLTDSPVCLVAPDGGVDMHMERVLKIHQKYQSDTKPILEINPTHPLIKKLAQTYADGSDVKDAAFLLLDQARIIQGQPVENLAEFTRRMSKFMNDAL